jgi:hypothetical protein
MKTQIIILTFIAAAVFAQSPAPTIDTSAMSPDQKLSHASMEIEIARSELRHAVLRWQAIMKVTGEDGKRKAIQGESSQPTAVMPADEAKKVRDILKAYNGGK